MKILKQLRLGAFALFVLLMLTTPQATQGGFIATEVTVKVAYYSAVTAGGDPYDYTYKIMFQCQGYESLCSSTTELQGGIEYTFNARLYTVATINVYKGGIWVGYTASSANVDNNGLIMPTDKRDYRTVTHESGVKIGKIDYTEWHADLYFYIDWQTDGIYCTRCFLSEPTP